ncbi:MAG TPA: RluA family pseudouridine synthase [Ferrovibrio sp.]|uniref:RluA family pseudouridine synthase n=1 Tax=Ferrovibrio sp. TaxID=1917215 RepID=UPI002ED2409E
MPVETRTVADDEADLRLDRWFRRHYPALQHGRLEKLLRTGQIRVDGRRAKSNQRLMPGQVVRIPPGLPEENSAPARPRAVSEDDARFVRSLVIYRDADVIALNKPPGLAVQGGTRTTRHLDAMLDALRFESPERPRLVHRLDRDTSGVLLLARSARAAASLGEAFRHKSARKIYWALVVGVPRPAQGRIDLPLAKSAGPAGERVAEDDEGKQAVTLYATVDRAGNRAAWLALMPLTGRTHQLRVHCASGLGTPIVGDGKYGGAQAILPNESIAARLHLHARRLVLPHPGRGTIDVTAPLPEHMRSSWKFFGFDPSAGIDPFGVD